VLRHKVQIEDLTPSTNYFYRATHRDLFGNVSMSGVGSFTTLTPTFVLGDFDRNLTIDFDDFLLFAQAFNTTRDAAYDAVADFDSSGSIDFSDFLGVASVFGQSFTKSKVTNEEVSPISL
tara:strand:+ start:1425 stop:1784 length:360 start_codon:yes stop_codon:yes gene_type:complete